MSSNNTKKSLFSFDNITLETTIAFFACVISGFYGVPFVGHIISLFLIPKENRLNRRWLFFLSFASLLAFAIGFINLFLSIFIIPAFIAPISFLVGMIAQISSIPIGFLIGIIMLFGNY